MPLCLLLFKGGRWIFNVRNGFVHVVHCDAFVVPVLLCRRLLTVSGVCVVVQVLEKHNDDGNDTIDRAELEAALKDVSLASFVHNLR